MSPDYRRSDNSTVSGKNVQSFPIDRMQKEVQREMELSFYRLGDYRIVLRSETDDARGQQQLKPGDTAWEV